MKKTKKKAAPRKPRKNAMPKIRNNGTMTESAFFGWIRSKLRQMSMRGWKPVSQIRLEARVPYKGVNKRRKYSYICTKCKKEVDGKNCAVHHTIPAGSLKSFNDLPEFCEKLFCEKQFLILLCNKCHDLEHKK